MKYEAVYQIYHNILYLSPVNNFRYLLLRLVYFWRKKWRIVSGLTSAFVSTTGSIVDKNLIVLIMTSKGWAINLQTPPFLWQVMTKHTYRSLSLHIKENVYLSAGGGCIIRSSGVSIFSKNRIFPKPNLLDLSFYRNVNVIFY